MEKTKRNTRNDTNSQRIRFFLLEVQTCRRGEILIFKQGESLARLWGYGISEILVFKPGESQARLWDYGIIEILIFKLGESRAHRRFSYLSLGRAEPVSGITGLLRFSYLSLGRAKLVRDSCI